MSDIDITRDHQIGKERCLALADDLGEQLLGHLGGDLTRSGDSLRFKTKGAEGELITTDTQIRVRIKLGLLTRAFKPKIVAEIEKACDKYLS